MTKKVEKAEAQSLKNNFQQRRIASFLSHNSCYSDTDISDTKYNNL